MNHTVKPVTFFTERRFLQNKSFERNQGITMHESGKEMYPVMKKILVCVMVMAFTASLAFGATFAPSVMKISAPSSMLYDFTGQNLTIPVKVTGAPAAAYFLLFTKDKGASIGKVRNGYLGWHYVNKIDTCVFVSPVQAFPVGSTDYVWNGRGEGGALVPAGEYTYYIFGYDNVSTRIQMTKNMSIDPWGYRTIVTHDATGAPMAQPWWCGARSFTSKADPVARPVYKWVVGSDPEDATFVESTNVMVTTSPGGFAYQPTNYKYFFFESLRKDGGIKDVKKWEWVPNGAAVLQTDWGEEGAFTWNGPWLAGSTYSQGPVSDGKDYILETISDITGTGNEAKIVYIDVNDGSEIKKLDLTDWWVSVDDYNMKGQLASGPAEMMFRNGKIALGGHGTCMNQLVNVYYEDDADAVLWANDNGDYTGDHNFEPASAKPWVCNDYNVGPYKYNVSLDANMFCIFPSYDMGAVSFGLYAPDGTGMSYQTLAGETAYQKYGIEFIDYGSAYDGMYTTNNLNNTATNKTIDRTVWYVAHDSIKGIISNQVGVADAAPAAFAVAQNTPNPFNPTTTINFSIPKAGKVTVEVFNAAGQKVDTIVNSQMTAGSHSVNWNAAKFSAGVYFCTVKSGSFSKTVKMTFLK